MVPIKFQVVGIRPKPWGTKEWHWRRAIATKAASFAFTAELPEREWHWSSVRHYEGGDSPLAIDPIPAEWLEVDA